MLRKTAKRSGLPGIVAATLVLALAACSSSGGPTPATQSAASTDIRDVGGKAPAIDLQQVLQAPAGAQASLEGLRGKVIVLEFWATWCPNCVKAIPHINELADALKGQPVQFIAVTDEDEKTVRPFLKTHPIRGWIGLNTTGSMIRSYGIHTGNSATESGRPLTVIIRPDGTVDARLRPYAVPFPMTAPNLIDLANGRPSGLVSSRFIFAGWIKDTNGTPVPDAEVVAKELISANAWIQPGSAVTDQNGHFRIDHEMPLSYYSGHPIVLDVSHAGYADQRSNDLRSLSVEQLRALHVTLRSRAR